MPEILEHNVDNTSSCPSTHRTDVISLERFSQYRSWIMAVAIIFIMLCHSSLFISNAWVASGYVVFKQFLQIGVDFFLFVSGMGIYSSLKKTNRIRSFYKKRMQRVLLPYGVVMITWCIVKWLRNATGGMREFLYSHSLISFFLRGDLSEWYLAAIIVLYLVSPLIYRLVNKGWKYTLALIAFIWMVSLLLVPISLRYQDVQLGRALFVVNEIFIVRIPLYIWGFLLESLILKGINVQVKKWKVAAAFGAAALLFYLNAVVYPGSKYCFSQWYITRAIFGPMSVPLMLLLTELFAYLEKRKSKLCAVFTFFSTITLELYLIHEKVLWALEKRLPDGFWGALSANALAVLVAIAGSVFVKMVVSRIMRIKSAATK